MPRRSGVLSLGFLLAGAVLATSLPPSGAAAQDAPPAGAWFRYRNEARMHDGTGAYEGYEETTTANARYEVVSVDADRASFRAVYAWTYVSSERRDTGREDRQASFSLSDRRYVSDRTDVSDYDGDSPATLATWIWIPPTVREGDTVRILERDFRVTSTAIPVDVAGAGRTAISLLATTTGSRDDDYGQLRTEITDRYWFDAATGMFLREAHEERATGTVEGSPGAFRLVTAIDVIDASYAPAATPPPPDDLTHPPHSPTSTTPRSGGGRYESPFGALFGRLPLFALCAAFAILFASVLVVMFRRRSRARGGQTARGELFTAEPLGATEAMPAAPGLSATFDTFLLHWVGVTRAAGNSVVVARGAGGALLGLGIGDRESDIGTIFAADSDVCESIRRVLGHSEFFSETRHPGLESVKRVGLTAPAEAYNIYETFDVMLARSRPEDLGYDTNTVTRMKDADCAAAAAFLAEAYGVPCTRWLGAAWAAGDLGWVAKENDRIVGIAMATVVGSRARLHSLTVHADARNRGLGTALYRARLRALFELGAQGVLTECATWNVAALELAQRHGFEKVGTMYVESARHARIERKLVRR